MGRRVNPLVWGPAAICDACGRACVSLDQAGCICWFCGEGLFMHRRFWRFVACPECGGVGRVLCDRCNRVGVLVFPKEDLDLLDLARELATLPDRYRRGAGPLPALIVEAGERGHALLGELENNA